MAETPNSDLAAEMADFYDELGEFLDGARGSVMGATEADIMVFSTKLQEFADRQKALIARYEATHGPLLRVVNGGKHD